MGQRMDKGYLIRSQFLENPRRRHKLAWKLFIFLPLHRSQTLGNYYNHNGTDGKVRQLRHGNNGYTPRIPRTGSKVLQIILNIHAY